MTKQCVIWLCSRNEQHWERRPWNWHGFNFNQSGKTPVQSSPGETHHLQPSCNSSITIKSRWRLFTFFCTWALEMWGSLLAQTNERIAESRCLQKDIGKYSIWEGFGKGTRTLEVQPFCQSIIEMGSNFQFLMLAFGLPIKSKKFNFTKSFLSPRGKMSGN